MKKSMFFSMLLVPMFVLASCDYHDKEITPGDMPTKSTEFIAEYFADCKVIAVDKDRDIEGVSYDVVLDCGVKLEFDKAGVWTEIDCEPEAVPDALVPSKILTYVADNYPDAYIVKIERGRYNYKVDLNTDIDLVFTKNGDFKHVDD